MRRERALEHPSAAAFLETSVVETPWIPLRQLLIRVFGVFGWKGSTDFGLQRLCLEGGGEVVLILLLLLHRDVC